MEVTLNKDTAPTMDPATSTTMNSATSTADATTDVTTDTSTTDDYDADKTKAHTSTRSKFLIASILATLLLVSLGVNVGVSIYYFCFKSGPAPVPRPQPAARDLAPELQKISVEKFGVLGKLVPTGKTPSPKSGSAGTEIAVAGTAPADNGNCTIVDAVDIDAIQGRGTAAAVGMSKRISAELKVGDEYPDSVKDNVRAEGDAKFTAYNVFEDCMVCFESSRGKATACCHASLCETCKPNVIPANCPQCRNGHVNQPDNGVFGHPFSDPLIQLPATQSYTAIHVAAPNLANLDPTKKADQEHALAALTTAYTNVFTEYWANRGARAELRLSPLGWSGKDQPQPSLAGGWAGEKGKFAELTADAISGALRAVPDFKAAVADDVARFVRLCVYEEDDYEVFRKEFAGL